MTDYDLLYSKFQLKPNDVERITDLHRFARACNEKTERIIVTTTVIDTTGVKVITQEVNNAELV